MEDKDKQLKNQIIEAAGNVQFTYIAHWNIVNRFKTIYQIFKITQIVLNAIASCGFLTALISGKSGLNWIGALASTVALALNIYLLNFDLADIIKQHTNAANELWEVREKYKSLIVDVDSIEKDELRTIRDELMKVVSDIYKKYPGTDKKSFTDAQNSIKNYEFTDGEAKEVLNISNKS